MCVCVCVCVCVYVFYNISSFKAKKNFKNGKNKTKHNRAVHVAQMVKNLPDMQSGHIRNISGLELLSLLIRGKSGLYT